MIIFGGETSAGGLLSPLKDLFVLDTGKRMKLQPNKLLESLVWTQIPQKGQYPQARSHHKTVLIGRYLYLYGGRDQYSQIQLISKMDIGEFGSLLLIVRHLRVVFCDSLRRHSTSCFAPQSCSMEIVVFFFWWVF